MVRLNKTNDDKICIVGLTFIIMFLCFWLVAVDKELLYYKYGNGCKEKLLL